ncbi:hypothetical protein P872_21200 [Rhodonellum psychrophilum GCM71 = DSM 17998]|uniref:Uncharacterized protein n=1 Tax=Rhodonellum psychrophilum GCM71 = DSM 17998 TaxID=1123057 RepID=U5BW01_9BACT|nr:hypothetical protein P872_21200 [Rhodonellum psychrophilum GCM71 = DSM 17998]
MEYALGFQMGSKPQENQAFGEQGALPICCSQKEQTKTDY